MRTTQVIANSLIWSHLVILVLSQIGVMEALSANTTVGNHTLDEFGHHGYGVSPHNGRYEAR